MLLSTPQTTLRTVGQERRTRCGCEPKAHQFLDLTSASSDGDLNATTPSRRDLFISSATNPRVGTARDETSCGIIISTKRGSLTSFFATSWRTSWFIPALKVCLVFKPRAEPRSVVPPFVGLSIGLAICWPFLHLHIHSVSLLSSQVLLVIGQIILLSIKLNLLLQINESEPEQCVT